MTSASTPRPRPTQIPGSPKTNPPLQRKNERFDYLNPVGIAALGCADAKLCRRATILREGRTERLLVQHATLRNPDIIPRRILHHVHHAVGLPDHIMRRARVMRIR